MSTSRARVLLIGAVTGCLVVACAAPPRQPVEDLMVAAQALPARGIAPVESLLSARLVDATGLSNVAYTWDLGDGSPLAAGSQVLHTYSSAGRYEAIVTATAGDGRSASTAIEVVVDPPLHLGSNVPIDVTPVTPLGSPIAVQGGGEWEMWGLREPGAALYDPVTRTWIATYTGRGHVVPNNSAVTASVGAVLSDDGTSWRPHPENPLTGADQGEDPYIAKDAATGFVWRDSAGRALMFTEEKAFDVHRGIELWRSAPNALSGWALAGRAMDRGTSAESWDATDRTSPTVVHDGSRLILLFEGRNLPAGQDGQVGMATSTDEGHTWNVHPVPLVSRGAPDSWNSNSIVPDDLMRLGERWILLAHGQLGSRWTVGRYETTIQPPYWAPGSFTELAGNPLTRDADTVMLWGNDPQQALRVVWDGTRIERLAVRPRN